MRIQLLSDLHLETEAADARPAPGAEALVLAGDVDSTWRGYERFRDWPCPVLVVAGNHEFDGRDLDDATPALREHCDRFGLRLLEREAVVLMLPSADLWLHGHLHAPVDYRVARPEGGFTRVVANPRGHAARNEPAGHRPGLLIGI